MFGNQEVLGGDTLTISMAGYGDLPDSINFYWANNKQVSSQIIGQKNEVYQYTFTGVNRDTRYWAEYASTSWFSAWDAIKTDPDTIFVTDRPVIQDIQFTIIPPSYMGDEKFQIRPE